MEWNAEGEGGRTASGGFPLLDDVALIVVRDRGVLAQKAGLQVHFGYPILGVIGVGLLGVPIEGF
jgi:hypothetical protein